MLPQEAMTDAVSDHEEIAANTSTEWESTIAMACFQIPPGHSYQDL